MMRRCDGVGVLLALAVLCSAPSAFAQEEQPVEPEPERELVTEARSVWTLQVDPLTTYLGYVHLQVERALTPKFSLYAGPHLRLFRAPLSEPEAGDDYRGVGLEVGARFFPWARAPQGAWAQVRGVGARVAGDAGVEPGGYVSALVGYTAIFGDVFVLSGGAGVQYISYQLDGVGPKGIYPALHTTLGVAF